MSILKQLHPVSSSTSKLSQQINHQHTEFNTSNRPLSKFTHFWIGLTRKQCLDIATQEQFQTTNFAHWLYLNELGLVLSFKHQQCVKADKLT